MAEGGTSRGTLAADLGTLLSSGAAADVTIVVGGVWLPAHKVVMAARSPVFAAMFRHDLLEASNRSVTITDVNQEVLQQFLQFMYTDKVPLLDYVAAELLAAADKYGVPRLKQLCEQQMITDLCVENAAADAVLAMVYSCMKLKAATICFINSHYKEVMATDGWANAIRQHAEDDVEICRLLGEAKRLELECKNETPAAVQDAKGTLGGDLAVLLESAEGSDVTLVVGGADLAAHRSVLAARSRVLAEKLKEAPGGVLKVDGAQEELRHALRFMYSDHLPPPPSVTDRLLALADDYALRRLKEYCEDQLGRKITTFNAMSLAVVATKHSCSTLRSACIDFIRRHVFYVMGSDDWEAAIRSDAEVVVNISKRISRAALLDTLEEICTSIRKVSNTRVAPNESYKSARGRTQL